MTTIVPKILSGRKPLFRQKMYVVRPNLPALADLKPMLRTMLRRQQVTNFGDFHNELEEKIRRLLRVRYAVLCCNGTIGLYLLLKALDLKGKVITTAFTFPATVHAVFMAGLEPLFCDIDPDHYTLDVASIKKNITNDTSCILAVNVFGNICDVDELAAVAGKHDIPVIYDSAHAFLCRYKQRYTGGFGTAEMFSFHATKLFTTIEGGLITTNDERVYKRLKDLINFGITNEESVEGIGLNGKLSEVHSIFGLYSFKNREKVLADLAGVSACYKKCLAGIPGLKLQKIRSGCSTNHQYMTAEVIPSAFGLTRDELHETLRQDNVVTRKYFYPPAHRYGCYREFDFSGKAELPHTETVSGRILCLPIYASLKKRDAESICALISSAHRHAKEIRKKVRFLKR